MTAIPIHIDSTPRASGASPFFTARSIGRAETEKPRKKPWTKVRAGKFKNDTVKFGHLDAPMSKRQRGIVSGLAQKAFKFLKVQGWTLDEWRRAQAIECCRYRISEAPGRMYPKLMAHFTALCGRVDESIKFEARSSDAAQRHAGLMHLIGQQLTKLPRLNAEDTEEPPKGTPRKTAWAWADEIATRKFGGPCRNVDTNALGTLHSLIKHEVSAERKIAKHFNKCRVTAKKAATEQAKSLRRQNGQQSEKAKAARRKLNACRCGDPKPSSNDHQIQCPACGRLVEGDDFAKVLAKWNKGGAGSMSTNCVQCGEREHTNVDRLCDACREAKVTKLIALMASVELIQSGWAGVLKNGNIVDRREHPSAIPIPANWMFGTPKPLHVAKKGGRGA